MTKCVMTNRVPTFAARFRQAPKEARHAYCAGEYHTRSTESNARLPYVCVYCHILARHAELRGWSPCERPTKVANHECRANAKKFRHECRKTLPLWKCCVDLMSSAQSVFVLMLMRCLGSLRAVALGRMPCEIKSPRFSLKG